MRHAPPCVLDTTVLSNFACTDSVDVLTDVFTRPATVPVVYGELDRAAEHHEFLGRARDAIGEQIELLHPADATVEQRLEYEQALDTGEAGVLAMVEQRGGVAITDDGDARAVAERKGIDYGGSLTILKVAVENGIVPFDAAEQWHYTWVQEYGYRSPIDHLYQIIDAEKKLK